MSDNPFSEPDDSDRTVFIPAPGGKRAAAQSPAPSAPAFTGAPISYEPAAADGPAEIIVGSNPLLAAASPLLQLLSRMRNTVSVPDPGDLRDRAVAGLRRFEQAARAGGVGADALRPAHFALCAALDDVALAMPWGAEGAWAAKSLTSTFHQIVRGGVEFFTLLKRMSQTPATMLPVLELMYLCLSLGFMGQYRLSPRGPAELDQVREELYTVIMRHRAAPDPTLSPHARGLEAAYRPRGMEVPIWVVAAVGLALLGGVYGWSVYDLGGRSGAVLESAVTAPPPHMPEISRGTAVAAPQAPVEPGALDRLRIFLKPEIDAGKVRVVGSEAVPVVRINNRGMFASGSAVLQPSVHALLGRIGAALKTEPGPVTVAGYTDSHPIHTVKFPSNFQLSQARAEAAASLIGAGLDDTSRVTPEGRADADPIGSDEQNRRIEVILRRHG